MQNLKRTILFVSMLLLAFACDNTTTDSGNTTKRDVNTVKATEFEAQDYNIPNELKYIKQKFDFLYGKFRPIGWSGDGKLAYIIEPADEACGCYFFELYIQDMKSDRLVYEFKHNDNGSGDNLSSVWDKNYELFKKELTKHKIIQKGSQKLQKRDFTINKQKYTAKIKTQSKQDPDFSIELVKNTKVFISKNGKEKQVMDRKSDKHDLLENVTLSGVIASPFEERIAIVLQEENRGYEGPPNVLSIRLVGASLSKGF